MLTLVTTMICRVSPQHKGKNSHILFGVFEMSIMGFVGKCSVELRTVDTVLCIRLRS